MKKHTKFKDELSKKDPKRIEKKGSDRKKRLDPSEHRPSKYKHKYLEEE